MTPTQEKIYKYILTYYKKHGEVPNARIVREHFKITRQAVEQHYMALIKAKVIKKKPVYSRYELSTPTVAKSK
jgi:predicted transcriptional regulator